MYNNKLLVMCAIALVVVGLFTLSSFLDKPKSQTSFCDSAPLEYNSNYPPTCYEAPQSWIEEGKVYKGTKLEVKK